MSTFKGLFQEIPGIAADRFDEECLQSQFLFLSHCHADHMVGISKIRNLSVPIFTSEVSAVLLRNQFPKVAGAVETLEIESPLKLTYRVNDQQFNLIVTAFPAKHCPGSVMFLFETEDYTVLYTGDFRILKSDFDRYAPLQNKRIDSLYMDSTFLSRTYSEFPTQKESVSTICMLIKEWLDLRPENRILIEMPAQYGTEFLFIEINRKLGEKIHVNYTQWEKYVYLPAMDECISPHPECCRIFSSMKRSCEDKTPVAKNFRVILPSAMFWKNWKRGNPFVMQVGSKNEYRVAYSNHSSCSELKDFLHFIQPRKVSLNVLPEKQESIYMNCLTSIYSPIVEETDDCVEEERICFDNIFLVSKPSNELRKASGTVKLPPKRLKL